MSELTKRLEGSVCYASTNKEWPNVLLQEAADRIEALEECLREWLKAADNCIDPVNGDDVTAMLRYGRAVDNARAILGEK